MLKQAAPAPTQSTSAAETSTVAPVPGNSVKSYNSSSSILSPSPPSVTSSLPSPTITPTKNILPNLSSAAAVQTTSAGAVTPTSAASSVVSANGISKSISMTISEDMTLATEKSTADIAGEKDPEFALALERQRQRKHEEEKLMCSLENKEACLMCSS